MVPARSETSKSAKSVFFEDVNDIDIFIEDTAIGFEKIYAILFSRVFSDAYSVEKVFPLGGRDVEAFIQSKSTKITPINYPREVGTGIKIITDSDFPLQQTPVNGASSSPKAI